MKADLLRAALRQIHGCQGTGLGKLPCKQGGRRGGNGWGREREREYERDGERGGRKRERGREKDREKECVGDQNVYKISGLYREKASGGRG